MHILAIFALIFFAGIIYAMCQYTFGRLILLGIGCFVIWACWSALDYNGKHPSLLPDPLPVGCDQELHLNSLGLRLYKNIPEINSLEEWDRLPYWSGWYMHKGRYYMKSGII
jgi:hypothetical protein